MFPFVGVGGVAVVVVVVVVAAAVVIVVVVVVVLILLSLSLPFVCAAAIVHNDGVPVGDDSSGPEGARGQAKPRDTPMMLATATVAFCRVKSNRIESNGIDPRTGQEA